MTLTTLILLPLVGAVVTAFVPSHALAKRVGAGFAAATLAVGGFSGVMRRLQNGYVRSYALSLLGGALLVVLALLAVNLG